MCCAMTSQHLVALPFPSPPAPSPVALLFYRRQGALLLCRTHRSREGQGWWWRWWCRRCHRTFVSPSPGLHVLLLHSAFHMQLYCIWLDARACCCRLLLSYWSEEKLPAEQRASPDISPASPVGQRITDSRLRLKVKMTCLLTGLQNQCKTKMYNHNNNYNWPGLEDLSIYCRASWVSPSGGVKAPLSLSASIHFSIH